MRRDTWHHGFNHSQEALRVVELLAPPPSTGSCGQYALTQEDLSERLYGQDEWLGRWPMERESAGSTRTMHTIRPGEVLWRLEGEEQQMLVGLLASTEHLTAGRVELLPGRESGRRSHDGDMSLYVLEGTLNVRLPDHDGEKWHELAPRDGFYVPEGVPYHFYNVTDRPARFLFAVAPKYLST